MLRKTSTHTVTDHRVCCDSCREAHAMAANADISRRKAERRSQKLERELSRLQELLKSQQRSISSAATAATAGRTHNAAQCNCTSHSDTHAFRAYHNTEFAGRQQQVALAQTCLTILIRACPPALCQAVCVCRTTTFLQVMRKADPAAISSCHI